MGGGKGVLGHVSQMDLTLASVEQKGTPPRVPTIVPALEQIRGFVAANGEGITRDEAILEELTKLLHAKVYDETTASAGEFAFRVDQGDAAPTVRARIDALLEGSAARLADGAVIRSIGFDDNCLLYAVEALQDLRLLSAGRDVIGEAYESLIFPSLRGGQGQFFTPKNVARCMAGMLGVPAGGRMIDPACGTGGFLLEVARAAGEEDVDVSLFGVDKDSLLARLASDSLALQVGSASVVCANSLSPPASLQGPARDVLEFGTYDAVITNPPFGARIPVKGEDTLRRFDLAHRWTYNKHERSWTRGTSLRESVPPQILFVELCWRLLAEGGRCAIVLPEGVLGNQSAGFVRQWLMERSDILAVVDCPLETFMPSTSTKTAILVFERRLEPRRPSVFMAIAEKCGHDRRGNPLLTRDELPDDDFPLVVEKWNAHREDLGEVRR